MLSPLSTSTAFKKDSTSQLSLTQPLQASWSVYLFEASVWLEKHSKNVPLPANLPFSWTDGPESRAPRNRGAQQDADGQLTQVTGLHVPEAVQQLRQLPSPWLH